LLIGQTFLELKVWLIRQPTEFCEKLPNLYIQHMIL